jgi:cation diffusion facilitator family transporter
MTNTIYSERAKKTRIVVILTAITMILEIIFGYYTHSMALLADGWHMSSHAFALGLSWLAYFIAGRLKNNENFKGDTSKILALSGYTSAIVLQIIAVWMGIESTKRLLNPVEIRFSEAIIVAIIGLIVNGVSAVVLHHKHSDSDTNIRAAYLHVLADGLTSLMAIVALVAGYYWKIYSLDALSGLICSVIITRWAIGLARQSGKELIGMKP